ncbi:hypothetical protein AGMMS50255_8990 [Spirochaetia bacterium]|nr:hypothetical protein AGMMS50255_8990 [Spirochaetia bacterium]
MLFLDEASSASPSVQAAAYQLVLDRQLGEARLKKGWRLILAGNRVTDGGVAFRLAMPLANRMLHVQAEADHDKWIDWGLTENKETGKPNIQEDVIKFLLFRPALLTNFELALKSKDMAFATPRSWEMVSIILTTQADAKPDVITTLIAAAVGPGPAAEFAAYRKLHKSLPDIDAVLQGRGAAVKCADKADVRHVATLALAFRVFETGETDITQAQEWSQRCVSWLDDLDVKWAALFINVVLRKKRRNGQLANIYLIGEKLQAWMEKHTDLITFRES